jgi:hypothetical protein
MAKPKEMQNRKEKSKITFKETKKIILKLEQFGKLFKISQVATNQFSHALLKHCFAFLFPQKIFKNCLNQNDQFDLKIFSL